MENPYLELDYKYNGNSINYQVPFVTVPSNLGKGDIWYFLCPATKKRCRKLYQISERFLHREAFQRCFYSKQVCSKYYRYLENTIGKEFEADEAYEEMQKPFFKKYYNGKPTKRYLKLLKKANL